MWIPKASEMLKAMWPAVAMVVAAIVVIVVMAVAAVVMARGCASRSQEDYLNDAVDAVLGQVQDKTRANDERLRQLEGELFDLQRRVEDLDAEILKGAELREALHEAIDGAGTIDDIDRLLRGDPGPGR